MSKVADERDEAVAAIARRSARGAAMALALVSALAAAPNGARAAAGATSLEVQKMVFVGSRAGVREVVLRSKNARIQPEKQIADLEDVSATVTEDEAGQRSFTMNCDRVELDIAKSDFRADGNVHGETAEGQRYSAPWVQYVHEQGLLYTDAPVQMNDTHGSFRGNGFRYHVHERRFELLGNVRVEQRP
jgi:LPS export ABC transporter protein LptC